MHDDDNGKAWRVDGDGKPLVILEQRNSTGAQSFRIYNSHRSGGSYEPLRINLGETPRCRYCARKQFGNDATCPGCGAPQ